MAERVRRIENGIFGQSVGVGEGPVAHIYVLWQIVSVIGIFEAAFPVRDMFQPDYPSTLSDTRSPVTDELYPEPLHVHQVHQAAEHIVTVIPALQIRLYDVIEYPFAVKAVVFGVDGLLKEAGALSPLQSLYFTHDTLTAVKVIQQALYVAGKVVIGTHGHDIHTRDPYLAGLPALRAAEADGRRRPSLSHGEGDKLPLPGIYKSGISGSSDFHNLHISFNSVKTGHKNLPAIDGPARIGIHQKELIRGILNLFIRSFRAKPGVVEPYRIPAAVSLAVIFAEREGKCFPFLGKAFHLLDGRINVYPLNILFHSALISGKRLHSIRSRR